MPEGSVTKVEASWWVPLYDDLLADVLLERDAQELRQTTDFLCKVLNLSVGDVVFDQCAGIGSLSVPLAQAGMHVVSLEQAPHYVQRAQASAQRGGVELQALVGDAFELASPIPCQAAFNWWTGFGYADSDEQNLRMLLRAYESLVPGGTFVLDWLNVPGILREISADCRHTAPHVSRSGHAHPREPPMPRAGASAQDLVLRVHTGSAICSRKLRPAVSAAPVGGAAAARRLR